MGKAEQLLSKQKKSQAPDLNYEAFLPLLTQNTFKKEAEKAKKVSWWKKLISVLSTGETGHAAYQFLNGKNFVTEYAKDIVRSAAGQGFERKTWADVLEKIGFSTKKLSDLFPDLYTETGKGVFKFRKGGFLDWSANGTFGLALDIITDPKTYIGGLGLFTRMGIKGKGLTKAGKKILEGTDQRLARIYEQVGKSISLEDALKTTETIRNKMLKKFVSDPDKYYSGITFLGKNVLPRKVVLAPGRFLDHTMQGVPVLGKVYTGAKAGIQDMFKYGADVIRAGKNISDAGEETAYAFIKIQQQFYKRTREISNEIFEDLNKTYKEFRKVVPKEKRKAILDFVRDKIEGKASYLGIEGVDDKLIDNLVNVFEKQTKKFYRTEAEALTGLQKDMYASLSAYMPHILTDEAKKMLANKKVAKFLPRGYREWVSSPHKARTWFKFVNEKTGDVAYGSKKFLGLQEYRKTTEERFLTDQADRLIKSRLDKIKLLKREINKLTKKQLREALKDSGVKLPSKVATLEVIPEGKPILTKIGETPTGLALYRKGFVRKTRYKLHTAQLKHDETLQFVENLINLPKKNVKKLGKLIDTRENKLASLLDEIYSIKDNLGEKLKELPETARWFKDANGNIWRAERHAAISDINQQMAKAMEEAGFKNKPFFMDNPFEILYKRGEISAKNIAAAEYYKNLANQFGFRGNLKKVYERNPQTRKFTMKEVFDDVPGLTKIQDSSGRISFLDEKTGIKYIDPEIKELPKGTLLPDFIVKEVKKVKDFVNNDDIKNKLLELYDKILFEWKGSVYGWYPSSHGRNLIGGLFNNSLAGMNPKYYKLTKKIMGGDDGFVITKTGLKIPYEEIRKKIHRLGVIGQTGYLDVNQVRKAFNPSVAKKLKDFPMRAMEMVENNLRVPLFVDTLVKTNSFEEAAKTVFKYHFDYAPEALTAFEKSVMKRLIPFYTWTRNNIPLMLEEFIAQPAKLTGLFKALRDMQDENGNIMQDLLPSYIEKQFAISRGGQTITGTGLPPIEMLKFLQEPVRNFESGLTPFLKIPLEIRTQYSLFKDMSIMEDTSGNFAERYPEPLKKWLQYEEKTIKKKDGTTYTIKRVDPMRKYWLYALPTSRLASILSATAGEKEKNKILYAISGLRTFEFDMQRLRDAQERMYEEKLIEIFTNAGLFGQIHYPYRSTKEGLGELPKD